MHRLVLLAVALVLLLGALGRPSRAGPDLDVLVDALGGTDWRARSAAYRELVKRKAPAALPLLRASIPAWTHGGQRYGLLVVGAYPYRQARRTWRKLFQAEAPFVRLWAGTALLSGGEDGVVDGIAKALLADGVEATVRVSMLRRLGWRTDERLREAVRALLVPGVPMPVLVQVVGILHRYRDRGAVEPMRRLLEDPRPGARGLAGAWLYDLGELARPKTLAAALAAGVGYAEFGRIAGILAPNRRIVDEILDAVVERVGKERRVTLLLPQIAFLGRHRYEKARPVLLELLAHPDERVSHAAFDVLVLLSGRLREDTLRPLLEGEDVDKRLWAAEALRQRDDPAGLPVVVAVLRSGSVPQRANAAKLLAAFATDEAVPPLFAALDDPHLDVRSAALDGLHGLFRRLLPYRTVDLRLTGYEPEDEAGARAPALARMRAWWEGIRTEDG